MPPFPRQHRMWLRGLAIRAWCALFALAVLFGVMQAGSRYFYCESLGLSATDPCAHEARQDHCPLASFDRAPFDCCQVVTMPSMPGGARAAEPAVPSASVVAILSPVLDGAGESPVVGACHARENERGRRPPRASRERRARLMVFLT